MNNPAKITLVCLVAIAAGSIVLGTLVLRDPQTMAGFSAYLASREAVAAARAGDMGAAREGWEHLSDDSVRAILTPDETRQEALLHLGSVAYGSGDYLRARELYLSSSPARVEADFRRLHDLGNTEYRLGEAEEYDAMRVLLW